MPENPANHRIRSTLAVATLALASCSSGNGGRGGLPDGVIAKWSQPSTIDYESFDPYMLVVLDAGSVARSQRLYQVRVLHGTDPDGYGHSMHFGVLAADNMDDAFIRDSEVEWSATGVALTVPSGHRVFIPKASFIGGR